MTQPQGTTTYTIAANGRLDSILNMHGETTSLTYNNYDEVTKKTLHGGQYEEYFYDSIGRLQTLNVRGPSHSAWRSENYTYNAAGEISQHTVDGVTTTYTYNSAGRLQQESAPGYTATYTFDNNGNRLTKTVNGVTETYTYDSGDKLLTAGNKTYTYDEAGRTKTVVGSNGTTTLTYDFESRLTQVSGAPGTHNYTYNGLDTRVSKNVAGQTTSFLRDGAYVTDPVIADNLATYTPGVSERRGGTTRYTHSGLKNTGAQSTNAIVATRVYDAYGMIRSATGTWAGPFGYAGDYGYQEDETGLRLLGHRYYDASTGRFLTRDPIKDGRNWYSYCDGDPINGVDPTGLVKITLGFSRVPGYPNAWHAYLIIEDNVPGSPTYGRVVRVEAFADNPNGPLYFGDLIHVQYTDSKNGGYVPKKKNIETVLVDDTSSFNEWIAEIKRVREGMGRLNYHPFVCNSNTFMKELLSRLGLLDVFDESIKHPSQGYRFPFAPGWGNDWW